MYLGDSVPAGAVGAMVDMGVAGMAALAVAALVGWLVSAVRLRRLHVLIVDEVLPAARVVRGRVVLEGASRSGAVVPGGAVDRQDSLHTGS